MAEHFVIHLMVLLKWEIASHPFAGAQGFSSNDKYRESLALGIIKLTEIILAITELTK